MPKSEGSGGGGGTAGVGSGGGSGGVSGVALGKVLAVGRYQVIPEELLAEGNAGRAPTAGHAGCPRGREGAAEAGRGRGARRGPGVPLPAGTGPPWPCPPPSRSLSAALTSCLPGVSRLRRLGVLLGCWLALPGPALPGISPG